MKKRIFISTNATLSGLFGDEEHIEMQHKVNACGLSLLRNYEILYFDESTGKFDTTTSNSIIIILRDDIKVVKEIDFDNSTDYQLHHSGASANLKEFNKKILGKHNLGDENLYEPVFKIIFDDKDKKAERIIKLLFKEIEVTIDGVNQSKGVQDEYRNLHKQLTLDYIHSKNSKTINEVSDTVKNHLLAVKNYFEQENLGLKSELQSLQSITDIENFYEQLVAIHIQVDKTLFKISEHKLL